MNRILKNKILRIIKVLLVIALILATIYVIYLMFSMAQISHERAYCRTTPLDKLTSIDRYYCKSIGALK